MGRGDGAAGAGGSEGQGTRKGALVIQLEDFPGREERVGTVNSVTTYMSGMTKKLGLLETSTWEERAFLRKRSKLSLK